MKSLITEKISKHYRRKLFSRRETDGTVFYFEARDFEGLATEPYEFKNDRGDTLRGGFYYYEGYDPTRLVVFDHGMGTGHVAYMPEIEQLARRGFRVLAYDHTGCTLSDGVGMRGLVSSLSDLNSCISSLKSRGILRGITYSVVGHSWGAFSTLNIAALHSDVDSVTALAGFVSLRAMLRQLLPGALKPFRAIPYSIERSESPCYVDMNAIETLKNSSTRALLIHSTDDKTVKYKYHTAPLASALSDRKDLTVVTLAGRLHTPHFTPESARARAEFFSDLRRMKKRGLLLTDEQKREFVSRYDWKKLTKQDENIWQKIADHINNK